MCRTQLSIGRSLRFFVLVALLLSAASVFGQTTGFTYQGRLTDGGTTAKANYDFQFMKALEPLPWARVSSKFW